MQQSIELIARAARATVALQPLTDSDINALLVDVADALRRDSGSIIEANRLDLERMDRSNPKYDRLLLTSERIESIANDMKSVATLPTPLGRVLDDVVRPNVLKGGSDADSTNGRIVEVIHSVLDEHNIDRGVCTLLPSHREATTSLLEAVGKVDLVIPRGSSALIDYVRSHSRVPVIETGAGICHTYFDVAGDLEKGRVIVENAKTRRVSVCNALDCLLVHRGRLADLAALCSPLAAKNVVIYADEEAYAVLSGGYPEELLQRATEEHYGTEFLDYKMSIRTVNDMSEALAHIAEYSSHHSECIVSEDDAAVGRFQQAVDAACVYANVSTAFTDGAQFGFGAEIGISTQKMHARGPMALNELTTYKYLIEGQGQVRKP